MLLVDPLATTGKQATNGLHTLMGSEVIQKLADIFLKEDDQTNGTDADHFVHNATQQLHLQHLGDNQPEHDKNQNAHEHIQRT